MLIDAWLSGGHGGGTERPDQETLTETAESPDGEIIEQGWMSAPGTHPSPLVH